MKTMMSAVWPADFKLRTLSKRQFNLGALLVLAYILISIIPHAVFADGDIEISDCEELQLIGNDENYPLDGDYALTRHIECAMTNPNDESWDDQGTWADGYGFAPIGEWAVWWDESENVFSGKLDGNGFEIRDLFIERFDNESWQNNDHIGMFHMTNGATISDLKLVNARVIGQTLAGGLAGGVYNSTVNNVDVNVGASTDAACELTNGTDPCIAADFLGGALAGAVDGSNISNVTVGGTVHTNYNAGGMVGGIYASNSSQASTVIDESNSSASVSGVEYVGGLVGYTEIGANDDFGITVSNSSASGNVSGFEFVGGLMGRLHGTDSQVSHLLSSHATGNVSSEFAAGGLVGSIDGGSVRYSYAEGNVTSEYLGGGLAGGMDGGSVRYSYAEGNVNGAYWAGGLIGDSGWDSEIVFVYATGNVEGESQVGGLIGASGSQISDVYASGSVTGVVTSDAVENVGGLLGRIYDGELKNGYTVSQISADGDNVGPAVGEFTTNWGEPEVDNDSVFYNLGLSGVSGNGQGTNLSIADMKSITPYTENGWGIEYSTTHNPTAGFPFFSWQVSDETPKWLVFDSSSSEVVNDKNGDGISDNEQDNVSSVVSPVSGKLVVLEVDEVCEINELTVVSEDSFAVADSGFNYPEGLVSFTVDCGTPGYTTTVKQYYYDVDPADFVLRKHNPSTHGYFSITPAVIDSMTIGGEMALTATYQITDGGELDVDGAANGIITDPAGLGLNVVGAPNTGLGGTRHSFYKQ